MDFLFYEWLTKPLWLWFSFIGIVLLLMAFDLGVLHRKSKEIEVKESLMLSAFYITLGILYSGFVYWSFNYERAGASPEVAATMMDGWEAAKLYLTGFFVEKSLAMDNVFVIATIFAYFAVPRQYQHRVLFWGIIGVILLRGIMIGLGATLVAEFSWVLYIFAAILIYTGIKMWTMADDEYNPGESKILKFIQKNFRVTDKLHGERFWVRQPDPKTGKVVRYMTPLFVCLIMVEIADVIFAIDSVPAIFAITTDPFIVYTSNIFAILGLRALYFALAAMVNRFHYLKYALSILLVFIGSKIFVADLLGLEKFPANLSLGITAAILISGVAFSLFKTRKGGGDEHPETPLEAAAASGALGDQAVQERR
jgi:tellurite resistance protein TerC